MRYRCRWFIGFLLMILLTSCSGTPKDTPGTPPEQFSPSSSNRTENALGKPEDFKDIVLVTSVYGASGQTVAAAGFYEVVPSSQKGSNLIYTDYASRTRTFLCNRLECLHKDENCTSWIASNACFLFMNSGKNRLFLLTLATFDSPYTCLWEVELNGEERKMIYQFEANFNVVNAIAADENTLYITAQKVDPSTFQLKKAVYQIDPGTSTATELLSLGDHDWIYGAYEDNLIILSYNSTSKQFVYFRFCVGTGTKEEIYCYSDTDEAATPVTATDGSNLYIIQPTGNVNAKILCVDMKTMNEKTLCPEIPFFSTETTTVSGIFDDVMILSLSDTRQQNAQLIHHYQYGINLQNGEIKECTLLTENGGQSEFISICGVYGENYCVLSGYTKREVTLFDDNGTAYSSQALIPNYTFIRKDDYWNNQRNLISLTDLT